MPYFARAVDLLAETRSIPATARHLGIAHDTLTARLDAATQEEGDMLVWRLARAGRVEAVA